MNISHFFWKKIITYYCDCFKQCTMDQYLEMYSGLTSHIAFTDESFSNHEKAVFASIISIGIQIKIESRNEFNHYSAHDINRITDGRFEMLAFMALHQGSKIILYSYRTNPNELVKNCIFIYEQIEFQAPNAITLSLNSFIDRASRSLTIS